MSTSAYVVGPRAFFAPYVVDKLTEGNVSTLAVTEDIDYELLRAERPELIFLDADAMTVDVSIVLRELRMHARHAIICLYTSQTNPSWMRRAFTAGANGIFAKYCNDDFQSALAMVLRFGTFLDPCIRRTTSHR